MKTNTYPTTYNDDGSETHILRGTKTDPILWLEVSADGTASVCDEGAASR